MMRPRVGMYGVLEKSEEGWREADALLSRVEQGLAAEGLEVARVADLVWDEGSAGRAARSLQASDPDLLVAVVVCWSFDNLTLSILSRVPRPLAILSVPGIRSGSLVGAQQLGSLLTELGLEHAAFHGDPTSPMTYRPAAAYARAAAAKRRLGLGKIGNVGRRTPGMTPVASDEVEVTRLFGCQVVSYEWEEIEGMAGGCARAPGGGQQGRHRFPGRQNAEHRGSGGGLGPPLPLSTPARPR